jgi:hypothetical protein
MTTKERKIAKEIRWLKKCFRCLRGWKVRFQYRTGWQKAGCSWSTTPRKIGTIAGYGPNRVPCDYAFHELFHLAFAEFRTVRGGKSRRTFEEDLIQDICKIYRQARSHK